MSAADEAGLARRGGKSAAAFRTTGEVAEELGLPPPVLRFWESKFTQLKPLKRGGGRRYYRPEEVDLLRRIRQYLHQEGYTIRGVQKLLREGALNAATIEVEPETQPETETGRAAEPDLFGHVPAPPALPPASTEAARMAPSRRALVAALQELRQELVEIRALINGEDAG